MSDYTFNNILQTIIHTYIHTHTHTYTSLGYSKQTASYETGTIDQLIDKDMSVSFVTVRKIREYLAARVAA